MSWLDGLDKSERDEIFLDACQAFTTTVITEKEFRETLARLGYNATDIDDEVKEHAPKP